MRVRPATLLPLAASAHSAASPARGPRERRTSDSPARTAVSRSGSRSALRRELDCSRIVVRAQRAGRSAPNGRLLVSHRVGERFREPLASDLSQGLRRSAPHRRGPVAEQRLEQPTRTAPARRAQRRQSTMRRERTRFPNRARPRTPAQLPGRRRLVRHRRLPARHDQAIGTAPLMTAARRESPIRPRARTADSRT